ncbi:MAG: Eco57I restriction-modification methylase domain-containing protein [Phycisphaerae bacterium]
MNGQSYKLDILNCLANLSNDEVFTPPGLVNAMLDTLPAELWSDKNARFLDPFTKSGVFLREIAKRLLEGLEEEIPDLQQRINHIYQNQLFGIAITRLTALMARRTLYCAKHANSRYCVCEGFDTEAGNIRFTPIKHSWHKGKCTFCGASEAVYARDEGLESHAYEFIHTENPEGIFRDMKFDVIVGNPPYQLSDGGYGISAGPIYNKFVEQAKKMNPRFITMIIPARWFAGGKGLDSFRAEMLSDKRIRIIHDFPEAFDCFPGVQIKGGVCYFLWNRENKGDCTVYTHRGSSISEPQSRPLLEEGCETFIRYNVAVDILHKVRLFCEGSIEKSVSSRQPFGLPTTFHGRKEQKQNDVTVFENQGISYTEKETIKKNIDVINRYKVFLPRAGSGSDAFPHSILGKPFFGDKMTVCSETYIFFGPYDSKEECQNVISYISTRFFRFLAMLKKVTQSTTRSIYTYVPVQDFSKPWTDEELYEKYGLEESEIAFIESMIRPME